MGEIESRETRTWETRWHGGGGNEAEKKSEAGAGSEADTNTRRTRARKQGESKDYRRGPSEEDLERNNDADEKGEGQKGAPGTTTGKTRWGEKSEPELREDLAAKREGKRRRERTGEAWFSRTASKKGVHDRQRKKFARRKGEC